MQAGQQSNKTLHLARLVFASPADLGLETGLDGVDGTPGSAGLAGDEEDTVLFDEQGVW